MNLQNKTNKQAEHKEIHRYREDWLLPDGRGVGGIDGKGGGVKKCNTNWLLRNSHGDVKYSIRNIVNNILITVCDVRWVWHSSGWSLSKLPNVALAGVAQWIECQPANQSVTSQGTCLGCGPGSWCRVYERQPHIDVSFPLFLPPFHFL